ncbi:MAG: HDOD domain-containing protein [Desulfosoma sp.]
MTQEATQLDAVTLTRLLDGVPMLPDTAFTVMDMMQRPDTEPKVLAGVVAQDPGLTLQTLHLCNSPFYSLPVEVASIEHAVRLLGLETVCGIVMAAYVHGLMTRYSGEGAGLWLKGARRHVMRVADCAQYLTMHTSLGIGKSVAWTLGLLHDIGKLVLAQVNARTARAVEEHIFAQSVSLVDAEWEVLGTDHAEAGFLLAQRWSLPDMIAQAVRWHHRPEKSEETAALLLYLADTLAQVAEGRKSWKALLEDTFTFNLVQDRLGLDPKNFCALAQTWLQSPKSR